MMLIVQSTVETLRNRFTVQIRWRCDKSRADGKSRRYQRERWPRAVEQGARASGKGPDAMFGPEDNPTTANQLGASVQCRPGLREW